MANHHLRNRELSLKAKGLLSLMLSLPEDWDYTTKGLSCICKDGVDSICATIKELEKAGYAFNSSGNRGIACGLNNLQKVRDGEPLGGKASAESDFATDEDDDFLD